MTDKQKLLNLLHEFGIKRIEYSGDLYAEDKMQMVVVINNEAPDGGMPIEFTFDAEEKFIAVEAR